MTRRGLALRTLAVCGAVLTVLVVVEILLRRVPAAWPRGHYGVPRFDPELGLVVHGGPSIYNGGRLVVRFPNSHGFMDGEHVKAKPEGSYRVGIFGDSFVEALQVDQEDAFAPRLGERLAPADVEVLAFGVSGWGTLHCMLAQRTLGPLFDIDLVIYSFARNDPGDDYLPLPAGRWPKAVLRDRPPGFGVVDRRRGRVGGGWRRVGEQLDERLLLPRLLRARMRLLQARSVAHDESGRWRRGSPRSAWPPASLSEAEVLSERILAEFVTEVEARGARFAVLFTPDEEADLPGHPSPEDSWWPWLEGTCGRLGIAVINPLDALARRDAKEPVFADHYTPAGHEVVAAALADYVEAVLDGRRRTDATSTSKE